MLFRKRYHFQISQNKETLTQALKDLSKKELVQENTFGNDTLYSLEFNWDEFVVTRKARFDRSAGIEPDAHIRLVSLSEDLTQIDVKIKFSEIVWIILIFVQLGIIAGCLFGIELHWAYRILIMIGTYAVWNFIIWLIFVEGTNRLKKVVDRLFKQVD